MEITHAKERIMVFYSQMLQFLCLSSHNSGWRIWLAQPATPDPISNGWGVMRSHRARPVNGAYYLSLGCGVGGNAWHLFYRKSFGWDVHRVTLDGIWPTSGLVLRNASLIIRPNRLRGLHSGCSVWFWLATNDQPDSMEHSVFQVPGVGRCPAADGLCWHPGHRLSGCTEGNTKSLIP